jgi:hypothetical protein
MPEVNVTDGILVVVQIKHIFKDNNYSTVLNDTERRIWKVFENVYRNFPNLNKRIITMKLSSANFII